MWKKSTLVLLFYCLLTYIVSDKKSVVALIFIVYNVSFFFLDAFKMFSL